MRAAGAVATSVEAFLTIHTGAAGLGGHYATFESAVHGFGSAGELRSLRSAFAKAHPEVARLPTFGAPAPRRSGLFWYSPAVSRYCVPFMGADAAILRRTQRLLVGSGAAVANPSDAQAQVARGELPLLPLQFSMYATVPSRWALALMMLYGGVFSLLAGFSWGRKLLLRFPGLFSHGVFSHAGPTPEQLAQTSFSLTLVTRGYSAAALPAILDASRGAATEARARLPAPDVQQVTRVTGAEMGYVATPHAVLAAALTILEERATLPAQAGVVTPGAAFRGTDIVRRLRASGMQFDVVQPPRAAAAM
jgi:hypothetical protein